MAKSGLKWRNLLEDRCPRCECKLQLVGTMWECLLEQARGSCGFVIRAGEKERLSKGMRIEAEDKRWTPEANQEVLSRRGEGGDNEVAPGDEVL